MAIVWGAVIARYAGPMLALLISLACTGAIDVDDTTHTGSETGETGETGDTGDALTEFERVAASYGTLVTLAGKGDIPTKAHNGWDDAYEGGDALDAELSRPHMTLTDDDGNLYIADKDAHAIRRVDTAGVITTLVGTGVPGDDGDTPRPGVGAQLSSPNGLWVHGDGTLFIHDMGNNKIRRLDADGTLTTLFETPSSGTGRGLWVSQDEALAYVSCGSVLRSWTPDGGVETAASGFSSLGNMAFDPDGLLVIADRGGHTVTRIEADGSKTVVAGNGTRTGGGNGELATETGLAEVRGIWFHPEGGYFLATHDGGQIWYVDTDGVIHLFMDGDSDHSHSGDGERYDTPGKKISEPRAITMDGQGRLLITENDHGYVRRVELAE
jgi:sugar lactone lactonase YvrE